jgi:hypothetical protein
MGYANLKHVPYCNLQHPGPKSVKRVGIAKDLRLSPIKTLPGRPYPHRWQALASLAICFPVTQFCFCQLIQWILRWPNLIIRVAGLEQSVREYFRTL